MGGRTALADSAWQLLDLPVEKPWSMPGGPFVCFLAQTGIPFTMDLPHPISTQRKCSFSHVNALQKLLCVAKLLEGICNSII